ANQRLGTLSVAERQLVEVARAVSLEPSILVLDEPTASLNRGEQELLLGIVENLRAQGVCVIYVSHRLEEVELLADRVTVLKDGRRVATLERGSVTQPELVRLMVGRSVDDDLFPARGAARGPARLEVSHLEDPGLLYDVSFSVHGGEIVGVGGLIGAG